MGFRRRRGTGGPEAFWRCQRGQTTVEFAFAVPLVLVFFVAIMEVSQFYYNRLTVRHIVQEAARFAVTGQAQEGGAQARVDAIRALVARRADEFRVEVDSLEIDPANGGAPGEIVRLTLHYRQDVILPWIDAIRARPFTASVAMKNEPLF